MVGGVDVGKYGESEDFDIYDVEMFKNKDVNLDENEYAYIRKLMEKRFALEEIEHTGDGNSYAFQRVKILESIATDNTINDKQKEAIFTKYRLLDDIYFKFVGNKLNSTYDKNIKQILNSNISAAEMLKKAEKEMELEIKRINDAKN